MYTQLVKELRAAFEPNGWILSAAVPAPSFRIEEGFQVAQVSKYLDFINVMTYDMHGSWDGYADHHAKLEDAVRAKPTLKI